MILTVDLGTSATKVAVWADDGLVGLGRAPVETRYLPDQRVEQDPATWWASVTAAVRALPADAAGALASVEALGFSATRQTFVPVAGDGSALGAALVWSDRRAGAEAAALARRCGGGEAAHERTGLVLDAAAPAAKVAWLADHDPARLDGARWLLAPRDLVVLRCTGEVRTDASLASASGLYDTTGDAVGAPVDELVGTAAGLLPEVVPSASVVAGLRPGPAADLGVRPGIPVVIGAGDRACEVLGSGAGPGRPMVSWGTTANVSVPVGHRPRPLPAAVVATCGALGGWLLEGGLSAAGSALAWLGRLAGVPVADLMDRAEASPPGARGATALPWFGGARAPWWRDGAGGAFLGLSLDHDAADLARALLESVALDLDRCLAVAAAGATGLALGGAGSASGLWVRILCAVTGLPALRRRSGEAASAGAALVAAAATGVPIDLERIDPVAQRASPEGDLVAAYGALRAGADAVAAAVLGTAP